MKKVFTFLFYFGIFGIFAILLWDKIFRVGLDKDIVARCVLLYAIIVNSLIFYNRKK